LLGKVFCENKKLNLELESASSEIASLRSVHNDMSAKPYDSCTMIMVNYADLCIIHSHVASLLDCAWLELREIKAHSTLLGACTSCPVLISDMEATTIEIKDVLGACTNLIILLTTQFYPLHAKHVFLSRVSFSMLPNRTPSFSRRLPI
jgi:hypothetical protein